MTTHVLKCSNCTSYITSSFNLFQQRTGYTPPPAMQTSGGTMMTRPSQPPYPPMRGTPMQQPQGVKRPSDQRPGIQQKP